MKPIQLGVASLVLTLVAVACGSASSVAPRSSQRINSATPTAPGSWMSAQLALRGASDALREARTSSDPGVERERVERAAVLARKAHVALEHAMGESRSSEDDRRRLRMRRRTAELIEWHAHHWFDGEMTPELRNEMDDRWTEMRKVITEDFDPLEGKDTHDRLAAYAALMETLSAIAHVDRQSTATFDELADAARGLLVAEGSSQGPRLALFDATVGTWRSYRRRDWQAVLAGCAGLSAINGRGEYAALFVGAIAQCDALMRACPDTTLRMRWTDFQRKLSTSR